MKVAIKTYGCTLNQADSDMMEALIIKEGHTIVESEEEADVVVVNTCTVKGATENKIIHYLDKLKQKNKKMVITGCLTTHRKQLEKYSSPLVGTGSLNSIGEAIRNVGKVKIYTNYEKKAGLPRVQRGVIARIAIQDGCLSNCTFCETKIARPRLMSQSIESIMFWINDAVAKGAIEIQLAGMDTGTYGRDMGKDLADLLNAIEKMPQRFYARVGMNNPQHIKAMGKKLLEAYKGSKIFKFLHSAVQSGSERVVEDMERSHSVKDFEGVVAAFREELKDTTVATDIIVGYPTEEESDFEETLSLIKRVEPDVINLSRFTPRPLTKAAKLKQLPSEIVKERSRIASEVIEETTRKRNKKYIGSRQRVVVSEKGKGRTLFYRQVVLLDELPLGSEAICKVIDANHTSLFCEVEEILEN